MVPPTSAATSKTEVYTVHASVPNIYMHICSLVEMTLLSPTYELISSPHEMGTSVHTSVETEQVHDQQLQGLQFCCLDFL